MYKDDATVRKTLFVETITLFNLQAPLTQNTKRSPMYFDITLTNMFINIYTCLLLFVEINNSIIIRNIYEPLYFGFLKPTLTVPPIKRGKNRFLRQFLELRSNNQFNVQHRWPPGQRWRTLFCEGVIKILTS